MHPARQSLRAVLIWPRRTSLLASRAQAEESTFYRALEAGGPLSAQRFRFFLNRPEQEQEILADTSEREYYRETK